MEDRFVDGDVDAFGLDPPSRQPTLARSQRVSGSDTGHRRQSYVRALGADKASRCPGIRIRTSVAGATRPTASANDRAGAAGSSPRWAPQARSVPQWIGTAICRPDPSDRLGRAVWVEMSGRDARAPTSDGQAGPRPPGRRVRTCRRTDRYRRRSRRETGPSSRYPRAATGAPNGLRRPSWAAWTASTMMPPTGTRSPSASSITSRAPPRRAISPHPEERSTDSRRAADAAIDDRDGHDGRGRRGSP